MKFPYGISDFDKIVTNHYCYVDRTDKIPPREDAGEQLLFLRPRRFGKSLLLSMLENYYDLAKASPFETLFGHLAIGKQPTPKHNQYFVMKWEFSMVKVPGDTTALELALHQHPNGNAAGTAGTASETSSETSNQEYQAKLSNKASLGTPGWVNP